MSNSELPRDSDIELAVLRVLNGLVHPSKRPVSLESDLTIDLNIDSDDLSFLFVPEVQNATGIILPNEMWRKLGSGMDVARALTEYRKSKEEKGISNRR